VLAESALDAKDPTFQETTTRFPMPRYLLPELRYDYGALEPHISAEIMRLHHDRHHRAYVNGANETVEQMESAREAGNYVTVAALEVKLAFHVSGHVLHSIFWQNLSPQGGGQPEGELERDINRDFGSLANLKNQLNGTAASIMGSGWAALVFDAISRRLEVARIHDHQSQTFQGGIPLLVIDAWEHAYYLQYKTEKKAFFEALWNLWSWPDVAQRYSLARNAELGLDGVAEEALLPPSPAAPEVH
jgi:Fe-Mn family superoxide dismutase